MQIIWLNVHFFCEDEFVNTFQQNLKQTFLLILIILPRLFFCFTQLQRNSPALRETDRLSFDKQTLSEILSKMLISFHS